jgi:hypothetical protein
MLLRISRSHLMRLKMILALARSGLVVPVRRFA